MEQTPCKSKSGPREVQIRLVFDESPSKEVVDFLVDKINEWYDDLPVQVKEWRIKGPDNRWRVGIMVKGMESGMHEFDPIQDRRDDALLEAKDIEEEQRLARGEED